MAVVGRNRGVGLAEDQLLVAPDRHMRGGKAAVLLDRSRRAEDFAIKVSDPFSRAALHEKFDIRNPERHIAVFLVRRIAAEVISPRAGRRDVIALARPFKLRALQALLDGLE